MKGWERAVWMGLFLAVTAAVLVLAVVARQQGDAVSVGGAPAGATAAGSGPTGGDPRVGMTPSTAPPLAPAWTFDAGAPFELPPVVAAGRLFAGTVEGTLYVLDAATGRLLWRYRPEDRRAWDGSAAVAGDAVYVGVEGGRLAALDPATGRPLWERQLTGEVRFAPVRVGDVLYVTTTFVGARMDFDKQGKARAYALRAGDGQVIWERVTDNFSLRSPVVAGGTVFVGGAFQGPPLEEGGWTRLYALRAGDGAVRWTYEGPHGLIKTLHATGDGPGDVVAFVGYADEIIALEAASGERRWRYHTENWTDGFAATGWRLWFGSANGFMHAVDVATGEPLWRERLDGVFKYPEGPPVARDGLIFFRTTYDELYALDAGSGKVRWRRHVGVEARSSVAVDERHVYVTGVDGRVYAFPRQD